MFSQIKNYLIAVLGFITAALAFVVSGMRRKNAEEKAKLAEAEKEQLNNYVKAQNEIEEQTNAEIEAIKSRPDNDRRDVDF